MPKLGDIASSPSQGQSKTVFEFPIEMLYSYIDSERRHIRNSIVDAGREEAPNSLEQFTELLDAVTRLAEATKSTEAKAADYTTLGLQVIGKILTTPGLSDKVMEILKSIKPKQQS